MKKDISDLQKIELDRYLSKNKYSSIFDAAPLFINFVNSNGIFVDCNNICEELLGYKKKEIVGNHYSKIIHPSFLNLAEKEMNIFMKGEYLFDRFTDYKMVKKDGTVIDVQTRTVPFRDCDGNFLHTVCFVADITERIKNEKNAQDLADKLSRSNQDLEQFAYVSSHDLQEPLRVVSNYCEMLVNKYKEENMEIDPEIEKWLLYIVESTKRMKNLIRELLDYSRVGRKDNPFEKVDINNIIEDIQDDFKILIKETGTVIKIEEKMPIIECEKIRIRQLFSNLINNAIKFRGDNNPIINISVCEEKDSFLFCVKDNGIGIFPKYFDRIFGLFKRLYSREEYPGTGIGLALCKRIVEIHGGKIWVDSDNNKGSSFYFTIPLKSRFN